MQIGGSTTTQVGAYSDTRLNPSVGPGSVGVILPGIYTYATLPSPTNFPPGAWVYTTDQGWWYNLNGVWVKGNVSENTDTQIFPNAGTFTWNKPSGVCKTTRVVAISGGGGGGSAPWIAALGNASGGGGGGGGGIMDITFPTSTLNSSETVVVGASGTPGLAPTGIGAGNAGTAGGNTSFGSYFTCFGGGPGGAGSAGATSSGGYGGGPISANTWVGGSNGTGGISTGPGGSGGGGSGAAPSATAANGGFSALGPSGGGCGGGTSASAAYGGGVAWVPNALSGATLNAGGANTGANGTSAYGPIGYSSGAGGGGGGANASGAGGIGGSGLRGGGGGGGGVGVGAAGGMGGYGGPGWIAVITTIDTTAGSNAGTYLPAGARAGSLSNVLFSFQPKLSDIGYTNDGGAHKLYSGIWALGTPADNSHYNLSPDGYVRLNLLGDDNNVTNVCLATQMNNSQAGALPYVSGALPFYVEFRARMTQYTSDTHMCVWLFDQAHNGSGGDYQPSPPAPYGVSNWSAWGEIDVAEFSFGSYEQPLFTVWDHHGIAGSYVNNEYTNTNLGPVIDATQWHNYGVLYDPINRMVTQYIDDVPTAHHSMGGANIGDINSPGPRGDFSANYLSHNFYLVMQVTTRGANTNYGLDIANILAIQ